ncbi:MAG: hypothetical protein JJE30_11195 [Desulfuromonadales bacterium]|nr:hypothetical protein [Desulfuromonadales bacterium]
MNREIKAASDFVKGTIIYVLDFEECKYLSNKGWDERYKAEVYEIEVDCGCNRNTPAYNCFELKSYSRIWTMGESAIKVTCGIAYNFHTFVTNTGKTCRVVYEAAKTDSKYGASEIIEAGDLLPIAWRGYGIEFGWLIDRWLRRMEGEVISADDECCIV